MKDDGATNLAGKYVAMGNIIINKSISLINPKISSIPLSVFVLISVIILATAIECPSDSLKLTERAMLAFGIAGISVPIIKSIMRDRESLHGLVFIGLFLLVFYVKPVDTFIDHCDTLQFTGMIMVGDRPMKGAELRLPDHNQDGSTNSKGEFAIKLNRNRLNDSCRLIIRKFPIDTILVFSPKGLLVDQLIQLNDTIKNLTNDMANALIAELIETEEQRIGTERRTRVESWIGKECTLDELCKDYKLYDEFETNFRNEYEFRSRNKVIKFKKNLVEAGVKEAEELEPSRAHMLQNHNVILYQYDSDMEGSFYLTYSITNEDALKIENVELQKVNESKYKALVTINANIREVYAELEISESTEFQKKRKLSFFGFLPREEFFIVFKRGKWQAV